MPPAPKSAPRPLRPVASRVALPTAAFVQLALAVVGCATSVREARPDPAARQPGSSATAGAERAPAAVGSTGVVARAPAPVSAPRPPIAPITTVVDAPGGLRAIDPSGAPTIVALPSAQTSVACAVVSRHPQADVVIAKNRWRFRVCASEVRRRRDPDMHGTFVITGTIDHEGKVVAASARGPDPRMETCLAAALRAVTFPQGDGATPQSITVRVVVAP